MIAWPLAELLPHAGDMILIDGIDSFDEEQIHAHLTVRPGGVPRQLAATERPGLRDLHRLHLRCPCADERPSPA